MKNCFFPRQNRLVYVDCVNTLQSSSSCAFSTIPKDFDAEESLFLLRFVTLLTKVLRVGTELSFSLSEYVGITFVELRLRNYLA